MTLYTKYGDQGFTFTKISVKTPKNHALVNFLGNVDELNCFMGLLHHELEKTQRFEQSATVVAIMNILFEIGAFMGYGTALNFEKLKLWISNLEVLIDEQEKSNTPLKNFILPTGNLDGCMSHMCRAVARRVERSIYELEIFAECELVIQFLNRLSDYLFSLARTVNRLGGKEEIIWRSEAK